MTSPLVQYFDFTVNDLIGSTGLVCVPSADGNGWALFGPGGVTSPYRYALSRKIGPGELCLGACLLNPSTADHNKNDNTVRRLIGYARAWGFGWLELWNVFAFRSTDPKALKLRGQNAIGIANDGIILSRAKHVSYVLCGWGQHGKLFGRGDAVAKMLRLGGIELRTLGVSADTKQPFHPLYMPADLQPKVWTT